MLTLFIVICNYFEMMPQSNTSGRYVLHIYSLHRCVLPVHILSCNLIDECTWYTKHLLVYVMGARISSDKYVMGARISSDLYVVGHEL